MEARAREHAAAVRKRTGTLGFDRLAQLLGGWQAQELRAARGFAECRGLSQAQLEDLYQDTAIALLSRRYASEGHLRNALRQGIRHRALNAHRDTRRRREILEENAPAMHRTARARHETPEDAVLAQQDRLIAKEFLAELDPLERQVFALIAEGMRYRAIATALSIPVNEARRAAKSCERKRTRFQLLHETGRICGYRAATIQALADGAAVGAVEQQARAHLAACASCSAQQRAPVVDRGGALTGLATVALLAACRWVRRLAGSSGIAVKATAVAVTAAVVAGGALGGSRHPTHAHERSRERIQTPALARPRAARPPASPHTSATPPKVPPSSRASRLRQSHRPPHPVPAVRIARTPTSSARVPPSVSSLPRVAGVGAAEREFGPER